MVISDMINLHRLDENKVDDDFCRFATNFS